MSWPTLRRVIPAHRAKVLELPIGFRIVPAMKKIEKPVKQPTKNLRPVRNEDLQKIQGGAGKADIVDSI